MRDKELLELFKNKLVEIKFIDECMKECRKDIYRARSRYNYAIENNRQLTLDEFIAITRWLYE